MKTKILFTIVMMLLTLKVTAQTFTEITEGGWGQGKANSRPVLIDLDNDGLLDMIIGDNRGILYYYEQDEPKSMNFSLISDNLSEIDVGYGSAPCFTDLDNDGLLDLIIGQWSSGSLQHYEQEAIGSTNFNLIAESFNGINVGEYASPCITDLDNDGLLDLIVGETIGNLNYYEQDEIGSTIFTLISDSLSGIDVGGDATPCIIDLDNDGLLDMIVGEAAGNLNHYEQNAPGSTDFTLISDSFNGINVDGRAAPFFADLDNDGLLDLIIGNVDGYIYHYEQESIGSITFNILSESMFKNYDMGFDSSPTFIDLDNNGLLDMIVGERNWNLNHYEQDVSGSINFILKTNNFNEISVGGYCTPCFVDLDNNGLLDLIIGESSGNLHHFEQDAAMSTSFTLISENFNGINVGARSDPCFTDLDNDGLLDLIIGEGDGKLYHYEQDTVGSETFIFITDSLSGIDVGNRASPRVLDLDHNGLLDLMVGESTGKIRHYEQDATGSTTFTLKSNTFGNIDVGDRAKPAFVDINGDDLIDVFVGELFGGIYYFQQDESVGVFTEQEVNLYPFNIKLFQNYPNPFNPSTAISYTLMKSTHVTLKIYNIQGQEIKTLIDEFQTAGIKSVTWDGLDNSGQTVASGVYIYQINLGDLSLSKKMILVR